MNFYFLTEALIRPLRYVVFLMLHKYSWCEEQ